jgi:CTP synthase
MVELTQHPFFVACQFHPEFKSRPLEPHPLFGAFVEAAMLRRACLDRDSKVEQEAQEAAQEAAPAPALQLTTEEGA